MFHKLCRITLSSAHRTKSLSVLGHELFATVSSAMLDWKWQNFFDHILWGCTGFDFFKYGRGRILPDLGLQIRPGPGLEPNVLELEA